MLRLEVTNQQKERQLRNLNMFLIFPPFFFITIMVSNLEADY